MNPDPDELEVLERELAHAIAFLLGLTFDQQDDTHMSRLLVQIQPTDAILDLAGKAAAAVFIAFERGYRLGGNWYE